MYVRAQEQVPKSPLHRSTHFPLPMQPLTLRCPHPSATEHNSGAHEHPGRKSIPEDPNACEQTDEFADVQDNSHAQGGGAGAEQVHAADAGILRQGVEREMDDVPWDGHGGPGWS